MRTLLRTSSQVFEREAEQVLLREGRRRAASEGGAGIREVDIQPQREDGAAKRTRTCGCGIELVRDERTGGASSGQAGQNRRGRREGDRKAAKLRYCLALRY